MLRLKNVEIRYDDSLILRQCDASVPFHRLTLLKGVSGSGKSSLLYRIGLISEDDSFEYTYGNIVVGKNERNVIRKEKLAFVLQDNDLFEQYDVLGNLRLHASFQDISYTDEQYRALLDIVRLHVPMNQSVSTLSGGEKQRVAIACALAKKTEVLILDEPTSFLDEENEIVIFEILKDVVENLNRTVIVASHSDRAEKYADQILEIRDGELKEILTCSEITEEKKLVKKKLSWNFYQGYVAYFMKKYKVFELFMTAVFAALLILGNTVMAVSSLKTAQSIEQFQKMSENQLFVTKDENNTTVDSSLESFAFSYEGNVIPFVDTYAMINGMPVRIFPLFDEINKDLIYMQMDGDEAIYASEPLYQMIKEMGEDPRNISFHITVKTVDGKVLETDTSYGFAGSMERGVRNRYLKDNNDYIWCDQALLERIYDDLNVDLNEQYKGYTILADDYDSYRMTVEDLKMKGYGVMAFFDDFEAVERLAMIGHYVKLAVIVVTLVIAVLLLMILEVQYFRKREREYMKLMMNGVDRLHLNMIFFSEMMIQMLLAIVITIIPVTFMLNMMNVSFQQLAVYDLILVVMMPLMGLLVNSYFVKRLSAEKIIRNI